MKVYLYAKGGHNTGLDALRRCSFIIKLLQNNNCEPILCTKDFKAAAYAKSHLEVNNYVSIVKINDLENILENGDILIYDTNEDEEFFNTTMKQMCTLMYKIPEDIPNTIVDNTIYKKQNIEKKEKLFFFSDEDKDEKLLELCKNSKKLNIPLLWGYFFTNKNKTSLSSSFDKILYEDTYIENIQKTKHLFSASLHTCLESIASGNKPILFKRDDKTYDEKLIKQLHLPFINEKPLDEAMIEYEKIIKNYPKLVSLDYVDLNSIIHDIFVRIETFRKMSSLI